MLPILSCRDHDQLSQLPSVELSALLRMIFVVVGGWTSVSGQFSFISLPPLPSSSVVMASKLGFLKGKGSKFQTQVLINTLPISLTIPPSPSHPPFPFFCHRQSLSNLYSFPCSTLSRQRSIPRPLFPFPSFVATPLSCRLLFHYLDLIPNSGIGYFSCLKPGDCIPSTREHRQSTFGKL